MPITTYSELQSAIADWLNRGDLTAQIPDFIALAESTLNRTLRDSRMVSETTLALTAGEATLPTNCLEIVYVDTSGSTSAPLEALTPLQLTMLRRGRMRTAGAPRFYAVIGRKIEVVPVPSSATSLVISFVGKIPPLTDVAPTNWLITEAPHLYLYASLMHAMPFLKDDARAQLMTGFLSQQIADAVKRDQSLSLDDLKVPGFSLNSPSDNATVSG